MSRDNENEYTKIEWTGTPRADGTLAPGYTFNPWIGCTKASAGCKNCYAENLMDKRYGKAQWGPKGTRNRTSAGYWKSPHRWNREAEKAGERRKVFCASLADVFEGPETMPAEALPRSEQARRDLFDMIEATPHLDWLILTKRPENVNPWLASFADEVGGDGQARKLPKNVWIGTSAEDQATYDARFDELRYIEATIRFMSLEPLIDEIDVLKPIYCSECNGTGRYVEGDWGPGAVCPECEGGKTIGYLGDLVDWMIAGGESGPGARPMKAEWVRRIRDDLKNDGVAFFFKQWGGVDKSATGKTLDGREHLEFPKVTA